MQLSTDKSEGTFFSTDNREATWIPSASLNDQQMPFNPIQSSLLVVVVVVVVNGSYSAAPYSSPDRECIAKSWS